MTNEVTLLDGRLRRIVQIVGYVPRTSEPAAILVAVDGTVHEERLEPDATLRYSLGTRHCAGTIDGDVHIGCTVAQSPYCDLHTDQWPCARCTGNCDLPLDSCREEHAIYLAAFAPDVFKVGVTRSWRLGRRLREQGAKRAAHLRTVSNGRIAREIEAEIATDLGDRVRVDTKIAGLHESIDDDVWEAVLAGYDHLETYEFEYGLDLTDRPVAETLASGTVVGTTGRILVVEKRGTTYAIDLRDLVGHELRDEVTDRPLQSSFRAFQ